MTGEEGLHPAGTIRFRDWLWSPPSPEESRFRRVLRAVCRIAIVFWHEFWKDAILLRASALTFTVILSLVPVLALSTAVLKGLGAGDQIRQAAYRFIDTLGTDSREKLAPPTQGERRQEIAEQTYSRHLKKAVDLTFDYVERTNFATLGIIGMVGLFITVVSLLATIEDALNVVWHAEAGRPLGRKIMDYLALVLLLPLAINISMAAMATLESDASANILERLFPVSWAGPLLLHLLTLSFFIVTLTIFYRFLPNTRVDFRPAFTGAIVGAIFWLLVQAAYFRLQVGVARYNAIYGSFATLPLFLLWVYSSWVVFLSGAEVAYAAHVWQRYTLRTGMLPPGAKLALAFELMATVYRDFQGRRPTDPASLGKRLGHPDPEVNSVTRELLQAGLLRQTADRGEFLLPAAPADSIGPAELLETVWGRVSPGTEGSALAAEALEGAKAALHGRTFRDFTAETARTIR